MTVVKTSDGSIFHLGRPTLENASYFAISSILVKKNKPNSPEQVRAMRLSEVELEEEREARRKFEELHPEETENGHFP